MPVHCQDCNSHFLLDATTVANGIGCPHCGGERLERDQPSPTKSDGELRNMVDPATQLDQGGNPLQEGVWAGVDGGWQPAHKRDEFFAKTAGPRGPFDMSDDAYELPSGGTGRYYKCPNCGGQMNQDTGECYRCGYLYGRDDHGQVLPNYNMVAPPNLGPIRQGNQTVSSHDPRFYTSMEPYMPWTHEAPKEAATKEGVAFLAPLAGVAGRMLLARALPHLMGMAVRGLGNNQPSGLPEEYQGARPLNAVAAEHTAVGINAPVETPGSVPDMVEDHDPEAVDQQEFNDGDMSPAFNNPNLDADEGGLSQSTGEDAMHQKLEFRHDGDGVSHAELLLPLIMEYVHSDKSALENPQIKALHDALDQEIPEYMQHAVDDDPSLQELLEALKRPHGVESKTAAPVYMTTPMNPGQMQMGPQQQQLPMPGTHMNPVGPGGMSVQGKCANCGSVTNADGSCPQCGASPGANQMGNMEQPGQQLGTPGIMPSPYARQAADHQGPITPQQKEVFAEYLIQQGRQDEVAAMMGNPAIYAEEWAQYLNRSTQPPEVDPNEQPAPPQPAMDPSQMGQMPVPGMSVPPGGGMSPMAKTADRIDLNQDYMQLIQQLEAQGMDPTQAMQVAQHQMQQEGLLDTPRTPNPFGPFKSKVATMGRCPKCESATTSPLNPEGSARCHRCGHIWDLENVVKEKLSWRIVAYQDPLNDAPNPIAAPAADVTAPGDREQQADSSLTWKSSDNQPLQVGQVYEMHSNQSPIPDMVKVQAVKPDSLLVTMVGEYGAPSDAQDPNGSEYQHEINLNEIEGAGLVFNPVQVDGSDAEQSQDQNDQDGIGQTVNTEPVEQPHDSFPVHTHVEEPPTDHCPKCAYGHVTSSYLSPELVQYECYRCAASWQVAEENEGSDMNPQSREWLQNDDSSDFNFDRVQAFAVAQGKGSRNLADIAKRDPRLQQISERLNANKTAGAKFSPREQKTFIDEDGVARNADLLDLEGTHYVSAFDNSKARPDRVNDNYLGLGL